MVNADYSPVPTCATQSLYFSSSHERESSVLSTTAMRDAEKASASISPSSVTSDDSMDPTTQLFLTDEARWEAVLSRDMKANDAFLYCVLSTSIFCRPICSSRRPLRCNVLFAMTVDEARAMGYRPCKRCKPEEHVDPTQKRQNDAVEQLKRALMENASESSPSLRKVTVKETAESLGISMWHLNRLFKRVVGSPPQLWAQSQVKRSATHKIAHKAP